MNIEYQKIRSDRKRSFRDWRFEALRILAMLFIVISHFFASDNWAMHVDPGRQDSWFSSVHQSMDLFGQTGVTWFVLISAFFIARPTSGPLKLRSTWIRIFRVWLEVLLYVVGMYIVTLVVSLVRGGSIDGLLSLQTLLSTFFPVTYVQYWFVSAYIIMIALAPFINLIIDNCDFVHMAILLGIVIWVIFIWRLLNPDSSYYTDYGYVCSIYIIGAMIRRYADKMPKISIPVMIVTIVVCWLACVAGTYFVRSGNFFVSTLHYPPNLLGAGGGASPILSVIIGTVSFLWLAQHTQSVSLKNNAMTRVICKIAPATLGIYLVHTNPLLRPILFGNLFMIPEPYGVVKKLLLVTAGVLYMFCGSLIISYISYYFVINPVVKSAVSHFPGGGR